MQCPLVLVVVCAGGVRASVPRAGGSAPARGRAAAAPSAAAAAARPPPRECAPASRDPPRQGTHYLKLVTSYITSKSQSDAFLFYIEPNN